MAGPAEKALADRVERDRGEEHHGDEGEGRGVGADVLEAVENLDASDLRVVEDQRSAEFGERPDEDDRAAGEEAGLYQREGDFPETTEAGAAKILGGFLHRGVDVGEGGDGVEVDDRVERERLDDDDAPELVCGEPIEGPPGRAEVELDEEGVESAVLAENLFDPDRADKGRQNHRDQHERAEQSFPGEEKTVADKGERQSDRHGEGGRRAREEEGVAQTAEVGGVGQNGREVGEGESTVGIDESAAENLVNRPDEKRREEHGGEPKNDSGKSLRHRRRDCEDRAKGGKAEVPSAEGERCISTPLGAKCGKAVGHALRDRRDFVVGFGCGGRGLSLIHI